MARLYHQVGHSIFTPFLITSSFGVKLGTYQHLPLQLIVNKGLKQSTTVNCAKFVSADFKQKVL